MVILNILGNINLIFQDNKRLLHSSGHHSSSSHHSLSDHHSSDHSLIKTKDQFQTNNELNSIKWDKSIYKKGPILAINYYIILSGLNYQYQQNNEIRYLNIYNETHWCKVGINYTIYNVSQIGKYFELFQKNDSKVLFNNIYSDIYYVNCQSSNLYFSNVNTILNILFLSILITLCYCYFCNQNSRFDRSLW